MFWCPTSKPCHACTIWEPPCTPSLHTWVVGSAHCAPTQGYTAGSKIGLGQEGSHASALLKELESPERGAPWAHSRPNSVLDPPYILIPLRQEGQSGHVVPYILKFVIRMYGHVRVDIPFK
uniref:Uncharacterized protein n=1 Tax=Eutreptiella gymnastica TaxID=73025 RepID=A0A7S1NLF5_9EUGL